MIRNGQGTRKVGPVSRDPIKISILVTFAPEYIWNFPGLALAPCDNYVKYGPIAQSRLYMVANLKISKIPS